MAGQGTLAGRAREAGILDEGDVITLPVPGTEITLCVGADCVTSLPTWAEVGV